ncbi:MAG: hypothetical protein HQL32_09985 [Planctomycetes bacterium]|nr:hypothetical protein [Planctomycetota bacterium]
MTLDANGLGIGTTFPSANLHVQGNAIISHDLIVGGSTNPSSSNLHVHGTMGYDIETLTSGTHTLGDSAMVLADTSAGNVHLILPDINTYPYSTITIKRINIQNSLYLLGGGGNAMDDYLSIAFDSGSLESLTLFNNGTQWYLSNMNADDIEEVASDNLFLWWKLDESSGVTAADSSSNGARTGTLLNDHNFSGNSQAGPQSSSLLFDDMDDQLQFTSAGLDSAGSGYGYSFWLLHNKNSTDSLLTQPTIQGKAGFIWASSDSDFHLAGYHQLSGGSYVSSTLGTTLSANTWYHIAVSWDGAGLHVYQDGTLASSNISAPTWSGGG